MNPYQPVPSTSVTLARGTATASGPLRVVIVDDHPAVRAVLERVLRDEPDLVPSATVATARDALARARRLAPDVVVVDFHLSCGEDGLSLARRLKALARPPRVLIYSAYADGHMTVAAIVAGADGIASKGGSGDDLCQAIRAVGRGHPAFPTVPATTVSSVAARLDPTDVPILDMLVHGDVTAEIAAAVGVTETSLDAHRRAILKRLTASPASGRRSRPADRGPLDRAVPAFPSSTGPRRHDRVSRRTSR